jgi:hypothetical protein
MISYSLYPLDKDIWMLHRIYIHQVYLFPDSHRYSRNRPSWLNFIPPLPPNL